MTYAAGQLGHPHGLGGWALVPLLNWQNRRWMDGAIDLLDPKWATTSPTSDLAVATRSAVYSTASHLLVT